jgi:hypothetical protein
VIGDPAAVCTSDGGAMTREERETTVRYDATRGEVRLWTADPVTVRKLARKGVRPVKTATTKGVETGWWFQVPYRAFRWSVNLKPRSRGGFQKPPAQP